MRTVNDVIRRLVRSNSPELPAPRYSGVGGPRIMLASEAMSRHTADAGWQLTKSLERQGYTLCGYNLGDSETDVGRILENYQPGTCVIQDKREWDGKTANHRDPNMRFRNIKILKDRDDIFKVTALKDAQQKPAYHRESAEEMGVHAWITYYHPQIVKHVAPYVRAEHCIRNYHTVDVEHVPPFCEDREGALLSGAMSNAYPLRRTFFNHLSRLKDVRYQRHPGYHANGCVTPQYLQLLNQHKVAICTSSRYGYSLRKIIEATACGCIVLTDLPVDDVLPEIDGNLVRMSRFETSKIKALIRGLLERWDPDIQREWAKRAKSFYDWRVAGGRLAGNIERLRCAY